MNINEANRGIQRHQTRKRIGRGKGSGTGKTSGRGHKGHGSRSGYSMSFVFEGGQMPLVRRVPKRGFRNRFALTVAAVNVGTLDELFNAGDEVSLQAIRSKHLAKSFCDQLKILGDGELTKALKISAHRFSKSALEKIQKAGGEAIVLPGKAPVVKNKQSKK